MPLTQRALASTRGEILSLLCHSPYTVGDLADALNLTNNAVRAHLVAMERAGAGELESLLREAGRRLAAQHTLPSGDVRMRVEASLTMLQRLGGVAGIEKHDGTFRIRSTCCPLAAVVPEHPEICKLLEAMLRAGPGAVRQAGTANLLLRGSRSGQSCNVQGRGCLGRSSRASGGTSPSTRMSPTIPRPAWLATGQSNEYIPG